MEAELTLRVLGAMLTKDEKKLMGRPPSADTRYESAMLAEKAERMTNVFFRKRFEQMGKELPQNLKESGKRNANGKKTKGAAASMVLSSVINFVAALEEG